MNYLAHLLLAGPVPEHKLGGLIGDFVRGRIETLAKRYSETVLQGISDHRKIDRFTDSNAIFLTSCRRVSAERRRVAGIIVDLTYDHFLSIHWSRFCDQEKGQFIRSIYRLLEAQRDMLPARLRNNLPAMIANDWLGSYEKIETLGIAFDRISLRLKRTDMLEGALQEVEREYSGLEQDFLEFFPQLLQFSESIRANRYA